MLTIPDPVKALIKRDRVRKNFRAHFPNGERADITNADVVQESLHFTESLCSRDVFRFGLAEASVIEFETVGVGNIYGAVMECGIEIDVSSLTAAQISAIQAGTWDGTLVPAADSDRGYAYFRIPLGVFRVDSCPRNHGAMTHRKVTAYSADQVRADPQGTIPGMPAQTPLFAYYDADVAGVLAAANGDGLTMIGEATFASAADPAVYLYDASGTKYTVTVHGRVGASEYAPLYRDGVVQASDPSGVKADFVRAATFDASAYYAQGETILTAIDAAGVDFTYSNNRKKIYASNREALLAYMPWLLSPVIGAYYISTEMQARAVPITEISPSVFHGILAMPNSLSQEEQRLFKVPGAMASYESRACWMDYSQIPAAYAGTAGISIQWTWTSGGSTQIGSVSANVLCRDAPPAVELYQGTPSGMSLRIESSGVLPTQYIPGTSPSDTSVRLFKQIQVYSYVNGVDYLNLANGCYELRGRFAKVGRGGGFEAMELSPADPIAVAPSDYPQGDMWWEEFDVSPIGSVVVQVEGANNTHSASVIRLGDGASVYDMSDNSAAGMLTANTLADLTNLLAGDFAANAAQAGFTPVELTMRGWPWMEAGDALAITTEDGVVVNTYALRIELSGIQHLTARITSQGGEIIGEA